MLELKELTPRAMMINHVKIHAEKRKRKEQSTFPETLNSRVDSIISEKAKKLINTHLLNIPIAIYVDNNYRPNNYSLAMNI